MAEFAAAAVQAIGSMFTVAAPTAATAGTTAATTAATAATTAATATTAAASSGSVLSSLFSASTLGSILSGGATLIGAMAAKRQGAIQSQSYEIQAQEVEAEIPNEQIAGETRRASIRDKLLETIAERNVAYAASGLDLSFGTPAVAQRQALQDAEDALTTDKATEDFNVRKLQKRAALYRMQGADARRGGLAKAAGLVLDGAADLVMRG